MASTVALSQATMQTNLLPDTLKMAVIVFQIRKFEPSVPFLVAMIAAKDMKCVLFSNLALSTLLALMNVLVRFKAYFPLGDFIRATRSENKNLATSLVKIGWRKNSPRTSRKRSYFFLCSRKQIGQVENRFNAYLLCLTHSLINSPSFLFFTLFCSVYLSLCLVLYHEIRFIRFFVYTLFG